MPRRQPRPPTPHERSFAPSRSRKMRPPTRSSEANKKLDDLEARAEALGKTEEAEVVKTEPTEDSETRERRELRGKARLTNYVVAAMRGRQVDGAEAEFSDACEVRGEIPLDLFQPDPRAAAEERVVTSAPGTVGVKVAAIQPHIFAPSIAPYLGIDMPMVGSGTFSQARINAALSAGSEAKGAAAAASAATFARQERDAEAGQCSLGVVGGRHRSSRGEQLRDGATAEFDDGPECRARQASDRRGRCGERPGRAVARARRRRGGRHHSHLPARYYQDGRAG